MIFTKADLINLYLFLSFDSDFNAYLNLLELIRGEYNSPLIAYRTNLKNCLSYRHWVEDVGQYGPCGLSGLQLILFGFS